MSVRNVELNGVVCTDNVTIFRLNVVNEGVNTTQFYYADVENTTSMTDSQNSNKYNMYNFTHSHVINNMYPIGKLEQRSCLLKYNRRKDDDSLSDYVKISLDEDSTSTQLGVTQNDNGIYILNGSTLKDYVYDRYDFENMEEQSYVKDRHTHLYRPTSLSDDQIMLKQSLELAKTIVSGEGYQESLLSTLYDTFQVYTNLSGIHTQYVTEIPSKTTQYYDNGVLPANHFNTKNHLNSLYSMGLNTTRYLTFSDDTQESASDSGTALILCGVRDYVDIDTCGDITYFKYYNDVQYHGYISKGGLYDIVDLSNRIDPKVVDVPMHRTGGGHTSYQHIEAVKSINRFKYVQHKSNLFSIRINDSGIQSSSLSDAQKELIKKDVENGIRKIVKSICPANTELFGVYWKGK